LASETLGLNLFTHFGFCSFDKGNIVASGFKYPKPCSSLRGLYRV